MNTEATHSTTKVSQPSVDWPSREFFVQAAQGPETSR